MVFLHDTDSVKYSDTGTNQITRDARDGTTPKVQTSKNWASLNAWIAKFDQATSSQQKAMLRELCYNPPEDIAQFEAITNHPHVVKFLKKHGTTRALIHSVKPDLITREAARIHEVSKLSYQNCSVTRDPFDIKGIQEFKDFQACLTGRVILDITQHSDPAARLDACHKWIEIAAQLHANNDLNAMNGIINVFKSMDVKLPMTMANIDREHLKQLEMLKAVRYTKDETHIPDAQQMDLAAASLGDNWDDDLYDLVSKELSNQDHYPAQSLEGNPELEKYADSVMGMVRSYDAYYQQNYDAMTTIYFHSMKENLITGFGGLKEQFRKGKGAFDTPFEFKAPTDEEIEEYIEAHGEEISAAITDEFNTAIRNNILDKSHPDIDKRLIAYYKDVKDFNVEDQSILAIVAKIKGGEGIDDDKLLELISPDELLKLKEFSSMRVTKIRDDVIAEQQKSPENQAKLQADLSDVGKIRGLAILKIQEGQLNAAFNKELAKWTDERLYNHFIRKVESKLEEAVRNKVIAQAPDELAFKWKREHREKDPAKEYKGEEKAALKAQQKQFDTAKKHLQRPGYFDRQRAAKLKAEHAKQNPEVVGTMDREHEQPRQRRSGQQDPIRREPEIQRRSPPPVRRRRERQQNAERRRGRHYESPPLGGPTREQEESIKSKALPQPPRDLVETSIFVPVDKEDEEALRRQLEADLEARLKQRPLPPTPTSGGSGGNQSIYVSTEDDPNADAQKGAQKDPHQGLPKVPPRPKLTAEQRQKFEATRRRLAERHNRTHQNSSSQPTVDPRISMSEQRELEFEDSRKKFRDFMEGRGPQVSETKRDTKTHRHNSQGASRSPNVTGLSAHHARRFRELSKEWEERQKVQSNAHKVEPRSPIKGTS